MKAAITEDPVKPDVIKKRYKISNAQLVLLGNREGLPRILTSRTGSKKPRYVYFLSQVEEWFKNRSKPPEAKPTCRGERPRRSPKSGNGLLI